MLNIMKSKQTMTTEQDTKKINHQHRPSIIKWSILTITLISIGINVYMSLFHSSVTELIWQVLAKNDYTQVYLVTGLEKFWERAKPKGNVVLRFRGFNIPDKDDDETGALLLYFSSVYHLYPQKVFAVPPGTLVNTPKDLMTHPFDPSEKWMRKHNVDTRLTFIKDNNGNIRTILDRYQQITPTNGNSN